MLGRSFLYISLAAIFGFSLGFYLKNAWEESKFIIAEWDEDPILVVCPGSAITENRVNKAIEWWMKRNYNFSYVHWDTNNKVCDKGLFSKGIVFIRDGGDLSDDSYAITTRLAIANKMMSASISIPNKNRYMPRLLEHEMGHAMGMRHVNHLGHIMHSIYDYSGENFYIPD